MDNIFENKKLMGILGIVIVLLSVGFIIFTIVLIYLNYPESVELFLMNLFPTLWLHGHSRQPS